MDLGVAGIVDRAVTGAKVLGESGCSLRTELAVEDEDHLLAALELPAAARRGKVVVGIDATLSSEDKLVELLHAADIDGSSNVASLVLVVESAVEDMVSLHLALELAC